MNNKARIEVALDNIEAINLLKKEKKRKEKHARSNIFRHQYA